jgi:hypothetical protein
MDEYVIIPAERLAQMQVNKEPPEASEVVSLDNLTSKILHRKDISDWEKASLLASTLERFLALKPRVFDEPPQFAPAAALPPPVEPQPVPVKRTRKPKRQESPEPFQTPIPEPPIKERRSARARTLPKKLQDGQGLKNWLYLS